MQQTSSNKVTTYVMYTLIAVAAVFLFFRYLYRPILPFFCAWVIASLLQSPVRTLVRRTGWDRRFFSVILVLVFTGLFVALLFSLFNSVIVFARSLLHFLGENREQLSRFSVSYTHLPRQYSVGVDTCMERIHSSRTERSHTHASDGACALGVV